MAPEIDGLDLPHQEIDQVAVALDPSRDDQKRIAREDGLVLPEGLLVQDEIQKSPLILERGEDPDEIAAEVAIEEALYGPVAPSGKAAAADAQAAAGEGQQPAKKSHRIAPLVAVRQAEID
jgi:hypothetical protein